MSRTDILLFENEGYVSSSSPLLAIIERMIAKAIINTPITRVGMFENGLFAGEGREILATTTASIPSRRSMGVA
ncbi:MAG: hypothetical protein AM326_11150 [Candidatus Thorarchaeota archaeon SMTZ-45]|nr:MAG: hypothetical protein AM326_11150 [Candidatus Thorarchaeota archaeon SMTZ-45]KXH74101.1 MAG: hypothetical protein AM325_13055 [Candidatus Thorarchaeota archaeon SMTZ1-45]